MTDPEIMSSGKSMSVRKPTYIKFLFMGSPFMNLVGVETASVVMRAAHHFPIHRNQFRRTGLAGFFLPETLVARGKTRNHWCTGAVGGFSHSGDLHGANRIFFALS